MSIVILVGGIVVFAFFAIMWVSSQYKRCPSDKILVIYGRIGGEGESSRCVHGGGSMVWPIIQKYAWLDLTPITISIDLKGALSKQNIRVNTPATFTVGISTEPATTQNAAERLLGMSHADVQDLARDIIFGQMRVVIATMNIEEINVDREQLITKISASLEVELRKVGLYLINVNIQDINDDSGYIDALGKEAAAVAVNQAKIKVAEQKREGDIGEAQADQDRRVQVAQANAEADKGEAEADRMRRISIAAADAQATEGENNSKGIVAESDSTRRKREAEADQQAVAVERVSEANAQKQSYGAEQEAEEARALRDQAEQHAEIVVPARIELERVQTEAQAEGDRLRLTEEGKAAGILAVARAEAEGAKELLVQRAEGLAKLVAAAGGTAHLAAMLMLAEQTPGMVDAVAGAVKELQIDKITVWDGSGSTAGLVTNLFGSVPPFMHIAEQVGGYKMPSFTGSLVDDESDGDVELEEGALEEDALEEDALVG